MAWKIVISICLSSFLGAIFTFYIKYLSPIEPIEIVQEVPDHSRYDLKLRRQRNELSRKMNRMSQELGQKTCEIFLQELGKPVHYTGGWCEKNNTYGHQTDEQLAQGLSFFLTGKRVGSFGDGPGHYKNLIDASSLVQLYDAYDGGPFYEETTSGKVKYLDLTIPQYGLPLYDWVVSLEVAEHIPPDFEATYLDNLVRHASEGIILSWAVPFQAGHYHVNNRPFKYVLKTLDDLHFSFNLAETELIRKSATLRWLKDNTAVFRRKRDFPVDPKDT